MQFRKLGESEISVAPLVLGCNVFGWTIDAARSFEVLDAFVDRGYNMIDTSDAYTFWHPGNKGGESETIIGEWFQRSGKRDKVVLATKVGLKRDDGTGGLRKGHILEAVEASLVRLKTDRIDLYQSHWDDESTPVDETLEAYGELIRQGKVRIIGASNYSVARLTESLESAREKGLPAYQTLQPEYNLYSREQYERELVPVVERYGLGVLTYYSLAMGFLSGKYKSTEDTRGVGRELRVQRYFNERGMKILRGLEEAEALTGARQVTIALAWLLARPAVTAPIVSATSTTQLESLFAAVDLKLTPDVMKLLDEASAYQVSFSPRSGTGSLVAPGQ